MQDAIVIEQLELRAFIGVPKEERAVPQRLTLSLVLHPIGGLGALADDIENTVDYFQVCQRVDALVSERPRHLLETLAEEIADMLLSQFSLSSVLVELRKYVLPNTAHVAVRILRSAQK